MDKFENEHDLKTFFLTEEILNLKLENTDYEVICDKIFELDKTNTRIFMSHNNQYSVDRIRGFVASILHIYEKKNVQN